MTHSLTIGWLDVEALLRRQLKTTRPLPPEAYELLEQYLDPGSSTPPTMEGKPVEVTETYIRVPWLDLSRNLQGQQFAREARRRLGLIVGEVSRARIVPDEELD
jgi:hypothetical protein